jgi:ABC-type uncharacterized transport system involved in gliding motility auxiliary subunit
MVKRIADIVGWLGTALVFAAVAVAFLRPAWRPWANWMAWGGLVCVLGYTLAQWREIAGFFGRRQARLGTAAAVSVLAVLGILVAINYIGSRQNKRWDLTEARQYSLSDQTIKVLQSLDRPLSVMVFGRSTDFDRFRDQLGEYEYASRQVSVEYIDADRQPARTRQYEVQSYGTVVLETNGRVERVTSSSEQDITNAIIKVLTGEERRIYFVQGHGEKDPVSAERTGYNGIAEGLRRENYTVEKLVLAQAQEVPEDAAAIVVAGPRTDFFPQEIEMLDRYLGRGGKLLVLLDPPDEPGVRFSRLESLLQEWAIEIGHDVVVDASGMGQLLGTDATVPVAASYPQHPITESFSYLTAFPLARSVTPVSGGAGGRFAQSFVETSPRSWAETDIEGLSKDSKVEFEEAKGDRMGPVSIAAAVSAPAPEAPVSAASESDEAEPEDDRPKAETRVAVVGDSDFAANFALNIQGNRDLFLNTVGWLVQQENLIAIRPRDPADRRVTMTASQQNRIALLALGIIPALIIGTGVRTWWRRR